MTFFAVNTETSSHALADFSLVGNKHARLSKQIGRAGTTKELGGSIKE